MSDQTIEPDDLLPPTTLAELPERLRDACTAAGWTELMPVQQKAIPYVFARRDFMVQSRTGSGKTGAFVLPILDRIDPSKRTCQALILAPTRELAKQVAREAEVLTGDSGIRSVPVYGGTAFGPQVSAFERGAHIVVGTPGRVLDHLLRRTLTLEDLQILVLDEADRLLSMGFHEDMRKVKSYLRGRRVNTFLFSATFPPHVMGLARDFLHEPETLSLSHDHVHVTDVLHVYCVVQSLVKDRCLMRILQVENPTAAMIFCNTRRKVHYVSVVLQRFGWDADELSADLSQNERERVLQRVRDGELRLLVATDVAARGIDIPELSHVIQYEPPEDPELYIHRAGRTGRAGASGRAITLASSDTMERLSLAKIAKQFEIDLQERPVPSEEAVVTLVFERITARLEADYRDRDEDERDRLEAFVDPAIDLTEDDGDPLLMAMIIDGWYQRSLRGAARDERPDPAPAPESPPMDLLAQELEAHGVLERERIERYVPFVLRLAEIEDESILLAMAFDDWYQRNAGRRSGTSRGRGRSRGRRRS